MRKFKTFQLYYGNMVISLQQHFLFQIFFNLSRLSFSFELTKNLFLSLDLVPTPTVAILKDCVSSVAILCTVEMCNAIQGNDLNHGQRLH